MEDKKASGNSQHRFTKVKSRLRILIAFCDVMTSLVGGRRAVDAVSLGFSKTLHMVSHSILTAKLVKHKLEQLTTRWVENMAVLMSSKGYNL